MKVQVQLRNTETGVTVIDETIRDLNGQSKDEVVDAILFQWLDDLYSCDCNRAILFFAQQDNPAEGYNERYTCKSNIIELDWIDVDGTRVWES